MKVYTEVTITRTIKRLANELRRMTMLRMDAQSAHHPSIAVRAHAIMHLLHKVSFIFFLCNFQNLDDPRPSMRIEQLISYERHSRRATHLLSRACQYDPLCKRIPLSLFVLFSLNGKKTCMT